MSANQIIAEPQVLSAQGNATIVYESEFKDEKLSSTPDSLSPSVSYTKNESWFAELFWRVTGIHDPEKRFVMKLDLTLLSAAAMGVMIRYLDQTNITNAFNSGMKEDLKMYGNELNYINAVWSSAYVLGQIPSNLILTRVNATYWITFIEAGWILCTFCTAGVKSLPSLYVVRFFNGLFEAGHFPAVMYIVSSYYKPHELGFRNTIVQVFVQVGPIWSGFLMAAVYSGLNNHAGLPGWRWLFIICGIFSTPINLWTFFAIPSLPSKLKPNWLFSEEDIAIAKERMPSERKMLTGLFKWKDIKRWATSWTTFLFPIYFFFATELGQSGASFIYWLKAQPKLYSVEQLNIIPLGSNFIAIFLSLLVNFYGDRLPGSRRWPILTAGACISFTFSLALAATPVFPAHRGQRMALYYLCSLSAPIAGAAWTSVNETNREDPEKRAFVSALMNAFAYIGTAFIPIFTFPTQDQPYVVKGNYITAGFAAITFITTLLIAHFDERDRKRRAAGKIPGQVFEGQIVGD